jgi:hypothetical protein
VETEAAAAAARRNPSLWLAVEAGAPAGAAWRPDSSRRRRQLQIGGRADGIGPGSRRDGHGEARASVVSLLGPWVLALSSGARLRL